MDLYDELIGLVDALNAESIDYALCGGIAVAFHGYPRFTKDIDLLVRKEDLDRVRQALRPLGFTLEAGPLPFDFGGPKAREIYRNTKVESGDMLTVDLLLLGPAFQEVWADREIFEWQGRQVQVVSAEGLARMKRLARRDQDLLDLKKLGFADEED